MTTTAPETATTVTPEPIMRLAAGFMAAKHLFAASELGLFEALADSPAPLDALAARTGLTPRAARISADAMVALGLLDRDGDAYRNSAIVGPPSSPVGRPPTCGRFCGSGTRSAIRPGRSSPRRSAAGPGRRSSSSTTSCRRWRPPGSRRSWPARPRRWRTATTSPRTGACSTSAAGPARGRSPPPGPTPQLTATVFELPVVAAIARERVAEAGLAGASTSSTGDAMTGALPAGHDVVLLANLAHYWSPDQNRRPAAAASAPRPSPGHGSCWPTSGPTPRTPSRCTPR